VGAAQPVTADLVVNTATGSNLAPHSDSAVLSGVISARWTAERSSADRKYHNRVFIGSRLIVGWGATCGTTGSGRCRAA
jgi:hypothetical protein